MDYLHYITESAFILIPVLYVVGEFIKISPIVSDWLIPWILTALGIAGSIALIGFSADGIIQGILVSGVTVLGNQLVKQTINKG